MLMLLLKNKYFILNCRFYLQNYKNNVCIGSNKNLNLFDIPNTKFERILDLQLEFSLSNIA